MKTCWVITNGTAGTVSQSLGLAQAVGFKNIVQKIFKAKFSFSLIPAIAHMFLEKFLSADSDKLEGPWPDVVVACGRRVIPFLLYIKKASRGKTYCIYVQDPMISPKYFDLIIKMQHDAIKGNNVISTAFSLNLINQSNLLKEVKKHGHRFNKLPKPYHMIIIGGNTKRYKLNNKAIKDLLDKVQAIVTSCPGGSLITTSRRTPKALQELLISQFKKNKRVYIITPDTKGENLYAAMLGLASKIFVTNDSVNMISEAYACEKPVCIIPLLNIALGKRKKFFDKLSQNNKTNNNNELIACEVRKRLIENNICSPSDLLP